ncbi:hypothetical protein ACH4SK_27620 [Streptomyces inhibens]|uniref:hypothetical protein n=1 Tax=Streptomyces inhibens TaxID=2293571 RepID=UPI00378DC19C
MSDTYSPIPELNLLKEFDDQCTDFYSPGFELREYNNDSSWSDSASPEFYDRVIPFAQATSSGSFYALWRCDDRADLATLPVILFGDEGDLYISAHNLLDLFHDLAEGDFDGPAPIREEYLTTRRAYLAWLERNFGPTRPEHERSPMEEYGWRFADWLLSVGSEDAADVVIENLECFEVPRVHELLSKDGSAPHQRCGEGDGHSLGVGGLDVAGGDAAPLLEALVNPPRERPSP